MVGKSFSGAPFGFQSHRFDLSGVHPKRKVPGTFIGLQIVDNNVGPGSYIFDDKSSPFSQTKLEIDSKKSGWKRSYILEQYSAIPYILNKDIYLSKQEQKRKLGPGYYFTNNSTLYNKNNIKGIMSAKEPRFLEDHNDFTPGPGNYGKDGIPHLVKEEADKLKKSPGLLGCLNNGRIGERSLPPTGCDLAPNTYRLPSFTDQIIKQRTGKRGPYDIFSLDRSQSISTGHLAVNPAHELAPGHYDMQSSIDNLNAKEHIHHGKFLRTKQYPEKPHDRAYWSNPTHMPPSENKHMGPGTYDAKFYENKILRNSIPPFNSSSKRSDKRSNMFFTQNFNQVGPGRYDVQRLIDTKYVFSHENVFSSKSPSLLSKEKSQLLDERLKAKNVPALKKNFIDHYSTEISPSVNLGPILHRQLSLRIS